MNKLNSECIYLYRYEVAYTNDYNYKTGITLTRHLVVRETEHTYFIRHPKMGWGYEKRVKKEAYNTYAYDTEEKAKAHFIRRLENRIRWYKYWLEECENAWAIATRVNDETN